MSKSRESMPQTIEAYKKLAARDLELIEEQRDEISGLKHRNIQLRQKNNSLSLQLEQTNEVLNRTGYGRKVLDLASNIVTLKAQLAASQEQNERHKQALYLMSGLESSLNDSNFGDAKEWYRHLSKAINELKKSEAEG